MKIWNSGNRKEDKEAPSTGASSYPSGGVWKCELPTVSSCGLAKVPTVYVEGRAHAKIQALLEEYDKLEWLAWCVGEASEDAIHIRDIEVPEQRVTAVTAEAISLPPEGTVGVIHSHHSMGAFFSSTDHDTMNPNARVSIVVSSKGWAAKARVQVPCGHYYYADAQIVLLPEEVDTEWLEEARKRIKQGTVISSTTSKSITSVDDEYADYYGHYGAYLDDLPPDYVDLVYLTPCPVCKTRETVINEKGWLVCVRCGVPRNRW